ncbi:putative KOW domain-containing protein domain-containing protein [Colletotrichum karsti]|uniref:KOW domain-containing protein domain-containing protein n=1 Tax=Colletotrichum karsti TaxID=1095194 RepID=A0A9P6I7R3_9PEZI|nr:putative KOW domain-containing protein domain-containing protein [Colletotrichum karsti]KAF9877789.1 putative KOW domain-containing protein domain-containing protein [Colletotrichum karsti]
MQRLQVPKKLVQRTVTAERVWARKAKKEARWQQAQTRSERFREQRTQLDELNEDIQVARTARWEKWQMGPIAPRRDIFEAWGATDTNRQSRQSILSPKELHDRCAWAGGVKKLNIKPKDRVVVLEGPERGKIDTIASINDETGTVTLDNICKTTTKVPDRFQTVLDAPPTQNVPMNIPISAIRLVHPIVDETTGIARDVIIRQLTRRGEDRHVVGENIIIPWPKEEPADSVEHPVDTKVMDVDAQTYVPSLTIKPIPEGVINELRNRTSVFRTRHDARYIKKVIRREEEKKAEKSNSAEANISIRTPLQELNRQQRNERRARGKPALSESMLEKIGEVIARNKARTLNDSGLSEVKSATPVLDAIKESHTPHL